MEFPVTFDNQDALDAAVKDRLARERKKVREEVESKYADYDDVVAERDKLRAASESGSADLKKAQDEVKALKEAAAKRDAADELAKTRAKVAEEAGVPADLVSGGSEDEMREWAGRLAKLVKPKPAPKAPKAGSFADDAGLMDAKRALAREMFGTGE